MHRCAVRVIQFRRAFSAGYGYLFRYGSGQYRAYSHTWRGKSSWMEKHITAYIATFGAFSLDAVLPGKYRLTVSARGFHLYTEELLVKTPVRKEVELCSFELHLHEFTFTAHKPDVWSGAATAGRRLSFLRMY